MFDALETDFSSGDLEALSAESLNGMFEGDADLLSAMETGATLNSEELEGFDDLLDSIDAEVLVTSELKTGFWDGDEQAGLRRFLGVGRGVAGRLFCQSPIRR